ncbi:mannose-1-phosphate guanylyltransferase [Spirochaetota bacterium]|nr:mannose-1-phosphate guanylyltransferase [Spirochaetota bacterium]
MISKQLNETIHSISLIIHNTGLILYSIGNYYWDILLSGAHEIAMKVILMAGGSGERLWPISRRKCPKQLAQLPLPPVTTAHSTERTAGNTAQSTAKNAATTTNTNTTNTTIRSTQTANKQQPSSQTLLAQTFSRLQHITSEANIFLSIQKAHAKLTAEVLPYPYPKSNYIEEPIGKDTAAAILLATLTIARRFPNEDNVLFFTPADHYITDQVEFAKTVRLATKVAEISEVLTLIGITPKSAAVAYGYLETHSIHSTELSRESTAKLERELSLIAQNLASPQSNATTSRLHHHSLTSSKPSATKPLEQLDLPVKIVSKFHEKPDIKQAEKYLQQGNFLWNAGMFFIKTSKLIEYFNDHAPEHVVIINKYLDLMKKGDEQAAVKNFNDLDKVSFDYAIAEKVSDIRAVPGTFDWDDMGSLSAFRRIHCTTDASNNTFLTAPEHILEFATKNTLAYQSSNNNTPQTIVLNSINNLTIIVTDDIIYIADNQKGLPTKELLKKLPPHNDSLR